MIEFTDPYELMEQNIGSANIIAREYDPDFAEDYGIWPLPRYDCPLHIPRKWYEEGIGDDFAPRGCLILGDTIESIEWKDTVKGLPIVQRSFFTNVDADMARFSIANLRSELRRVSCAVAVDKILERYNTSLENARFTLRDLTPEEAIELEQDWRTAKPLT